MDTIDIFWLGSIVITILYFVTFLDKKCHSELMIWINAEKSKTKIIKTNEQERVNKVETINSSILKAENVK